MEEWMGGRRMNRMSIPRGDGPARLFSRQECIPRGRDEVPREHLRVH